MLNREFTKKEKLLLVACLLLALGIFYYQFIFKGVRQRISEYSTDGLQSEIEVEQQRSAQIASMQKVIEDNKDVKRGDLMVYNNLANEIHLVGEIMKRKAEAVSISWETPVLNGTTVRRGANITFTTRRYKHLKEILQSFHDCMYRCVTQDLTVADNSPTSRTVNARVGGRMTSVSMTQTRRGIKHSTRMSVSFHVTFFETIEGASTTEGLIIQSTGSSSDLEGALADRAHAYD